VINAIYIVVGFIYWAINVFVRDLPFRGKHEDMWLMSPVWVILWPVCFLILILLKILKSLKLIKP